MHLNLAWYHHSFATPKLTTVGSPLFLLSAELHFLPTCDCTLIQSYLIFSSCLCAVCASCGPFRVGTGRRGCQLCRDALGASLPPRARPTRAESAALRVRYTLVACHRHLRGSGSLSETQTCRREKRLRLLRTHETPLTTKGRGAGRVRRNKRVDAHTKWTLLRDSFKNSSVPINMENPQLHILMLFQSHWKVLVTTAIIICKFVIRAFCVALWLKLNSKSLSNTLP